MLYPPVRCATHTPQPPLSVSRACAQYYRGDDRGTRTKARSVHWLMRYTRIEPSQLVIGSAMCARGDLSFFILEQLSATRQAHTSGSPLLSEEVEAAVTWGLLFAMLVAPFLLRWADTLIKRSARRIGRRMTVSGAFASGKVGGATGHGSGVNGANSSSSANSPAGRGQGRSGRSSPQPQRQAAELAPAPSCASRRGSGGNRSGGAAALAGTSVPLTRHSVPTRGVRRQSSVQFSPSVLVPSTAPALGSSDCRESRASYNRRGSTMVLGESMRTLTRQSTSVLSRLASSESFQRRDSIGVNVRVRPPLAAPSEPSEPSAPSARFDARAECHPCSPPLALMPKRAIACRVRSPRCPCAKRPSAPPHSYVRARRARVHAPAV